MESPKRTYQPNVCGIQAELTRRHLLGAVGSGFGALALSSLLPNSSACGDPKGFQSMEKPLSNLASPSSSRRKIVITNCNLIDSVGEIPRQNTSVIIENGRIAEVFTGSKGINAKTAEIVDCQGAWMLPGLWDVHVHLQFPDISPPKELTARTIKYGLNAMDGLREAGITAIRTAGVEHWIDVAWKRAFASGQILGPRIFAGGYFLTTTGGHGHGQPFSLECDGSEAFLKAVREQIQNGVDHIKLNLSGGIMGPPWDRHWHNFLLPEEQEAVFRLCHQREFKVMAHATNPQAVKDAIRLGAWSVEHGYVLDDQCIQMMLENKTIYVPTLAVSHLTPRQAISRWEKQFLEIWERQIPPEFFARADAAAEEHKKWFQRALKAGVRMALGSDLGPLKDGPLLEMGLWVRDGATPMQTIKAATKIAAETCGVGQELGTVEKGKIADLIVVKDNPLEDINNLRTLQMVFQNGHLVVDKRGDV